MSSAAEPIFDQIPPQGAVKVRLKTRFKGRAGGTPVITCEILTQEAVQTAIDASDSLRRYLNVIAKDLGPPPWEIHAELTWLGFDGGPIDNPIPVQFLYFGGMQKEEGSGSAVAMQAIQALRDLAIEKERSHQTLLQTLGAVYAAGADKSAEAAAKVLGAGAEPLKAAIAEIAQTRKEETERANAANKKLVATIEGGKQTKPDSWADDLVKLAPLLPLAGAALKKMMPNN